MSPEEWLAQQQATQQTTQATQQTTQTTPIPPMSPEAWLEQDMANIVAQIPTGIGGVTEEEFSQAPPSDHPEINPLALPVGIAETAVSTGTGVLSQLAGTLEGIAKELVNLNFGQGMAEATARQRMEQGTYQPRTETGQAVAEVVSDVGEALAPLTAVAPMTAELRAIASGTRALTPVQQAAKRAAERVKRSKQVESTAGTGATTGAMAVDKGAVRQEQAKELPVPIKLTEGQKTREFGQQRFERETAKIPEEGTPLRERFAEQNLQLQQNMDAFIDQTGAELTSLRGVGEAVNTTIRQRAAKDKARIRILYKEAAKAGEMETPVDMDSLAQYLNKNRALRTEEGLLTKVQRQLDTLEVGQGTFENGSLQLKPMTLNQTEAVRRFINDNTNSANAPEVRIATQLKKVIDTATEGKGGDKYKRARRARTKYAEEYKNVGLVKRLIGTKRGSDDRAIAIEDVLRKVILEPSTSLDEMRSVRRLLQTRTGGKEGPGVQAWKELQGATVRHIQEQMTKGITTDQAGNRIVSPAQLDRVISQLDRSGKLDFIFGKKGAEQLRVINDVAKDVLTSPPGVINTSNTASVLAAMMDVVISGLSATPAPVVSGFRYVTKSIKDRKLRARVKQALGE